MRHVTGKADRRGLILDFAGVLTAAPADVHRAWCVSEGLAPGSWRGVLNDHPEGRRLYTALEIGEIGQREWNQGTARLLGEHVDPVNLMGRAWAEVPVAA
ncbi:HAD family phosphatase, partial [Streptomyces sp. SID11233]|nr:HAD family phosphatase [Streptomyces sp. SID11233]